MKLDKISSFLVFVVTRFAKRFVDYYLLLNLIINQLLLNRCWITYFHVGFDKKPYSYTFLAAEYVEYAF